MRNTATVMVMLIVLTGFLFLFSTTHSAQQPQVRDTEPVDCTITAISGPKRNPIITLRCPTPSLLKVCEPSKMRTRPECLETILDIPVKEWPEQWQGEPLKLGTKFKARYVDGHFKTLGMATYCKKTFDKAIEDYCGGMYCRPPINSLVPEPCLYNSGLIWGR